MDDPVTRCCKPPAVAFGSVMRFATPWLPSDVAPRAPSPPEADQSRGLPARPAGGHFPLLHLSLTRPSDSPPKEKTQIDAGATGQVLPPRPPNLPRGNKSKAATPSLVPVPSSDGARCLGGTSRPPLRSGRVSWPSNSMEPGQRSPAPPASFAPGSHPGRLKGRKMLMRLGASSSLICGLFQADPVA